MSRDYLQHGRRHAPLGGSDPIAPTPYIAGSVGGITIASGSTGTVIDIDPSVHPWGTDGGAKTASDYFDLRKPGSVYEIALLRNALYVIDASAFINMGATAIPAGSAGEINFASTSSGGAIQIGGEATDQFKTQIGSTSIHVAQPSMRALLNAPSSYGAAPIYTSISIGQNGGATATSVQLNFLVTLLGFGNTGF